MRYLILLILASLLALPANAAELLIIQSHRNQIFDQTVSQIKNSCGKKSQTYVMGNYAEFDLGRIVREEQPRLVVIIGDKPLKEALKLRKTPVIYTMALTAEEISHRENISGVSMHASPDNYLKLLKKLGLRRTGIAYNNEKSGAYIARAMKLAANYGINLVAMQVKSPQEVDSALSRLTSSGIDSIWMIPDTTAVTAQNVDSYFQMAQKANIPLIGFSRTYLEKGALAALEASRNKMTEQLCSKITQILNGIDSADSRTTDISTASLYTNETIAQRFGISLTGVDQLFIIGQK